MQAIILAAGKSTRFGENKLTVQFQNLTLVEHGLKFLKLNGITGKIFVVINKADVYISNKNKIIQPVMHKLLGSPYFSDNIEFIFQNTEEYGPAAGLRTCANKITEDYIVLFGDNYYSGIIDISFGGAQAIATAKHHEKHIDNRRFAYADMQNNRIVEKPHDHMEGDFFCGYLLMKKETVANLQTLTPSARNEFEITEFFNSCEKRLIRKINCDWMDIATYDQVVEVSKYVSETFIPD